MPRSSHDFNKQSKTNGISVAETLGRRSSQQDAMFVGYVDGDAKTKPRSFLKNTIATIEKNHKECGAGTTLCSAIVQKDGDDAKINIANLGDSRAALIIKYKDASNHIQYRSIVLTEDHDLSVDRVSSHIKDNGGRINGGRVNGSLNMGASIGDRSTLDAYNGKDCLLRDPDIFSYKLSSIYKKIGISPDSVEDVDLLVSCDGVWDLNGKKGMSADHEIYSSGSGFKIKKPDSSTVRMSDVKREFDNHGKGQSFSQYLIDYSYEQGSGDNISAITVPLISKKKTLLSDKPIMATVCDGHGEGKFFDTDDRDATHAYSKRPNWDGSIVSASVAADLYLAAKMQPISGIEVDEDKQKYLSELIKKRSAKVSEIEPDKQNWYIPKWNDEESEKARKSRVKGSAASKVSSTQSYMKSNKKDFANLGLDTDAESLEKFNNNFPSFQRISGDGLCMIHAPLVGTLLKCVGDESKLDRFKDNLKNWRDNLEVTSSITTADIESAKNAITRFLVKINKSNFSYEDFYKLVDENGSEQNALKDLSKALLSCTNFEDNAAKQSFCRTGGSEDIWSSFQKEQASYKDDPKKATELTYNISQYILSSVSPFKMEILHDKSSLNKPLSQDSIYMIHGKGSGDAYHVDILHSRLDLSLLSAVSKIESDVTKESSKKTKPKVANEPFIDALDTADVVFPVSKPDLKSTKSDVKKTASIPKKSTAKDEKSLNFISKPKQIGDELESLKKEFTVTALNKPSFSEVSSFANSDISKGKGKAIRKLEKYGNVDKKTESLLDKEISNKEKVFTNKLVKALNNLRKSPEKSTASAESSWKSLTTLDRRILVDYYNSNHDEKISFESLYKEAKGQKGELTINSQDYVLDSTKIEDVVNVLKYASLAIPTESIQNPTVKKLRESANVRT